MNNRLTSILLDNFDRASGFHDRLNIHVNNYSQIDRAIARTVVRSVFDGAELLLADIKDKIELKNEFY